MSLPKLMAGRSHQVGRLLTCFYVAPLGKNRSCDARFRKVVRAVFSVLGVAAACVSPGQHLACIWASRQYRWIDGTKDRTDPKRGRNAVGRGGVGINPRRALSPATILARRSPTFLISHSSTTRRVEMQPARRPRSGTWTLTHRSAGLRLNSSSSTRPTGPSCSPTNVNSRFDGAAKFACIQRSTRASGRHSRGPASQSPSITLSSAIATTPGSRSRPSLNRKAGWDQRQSMTSSLAPTAQLKLTSMQLLVMRTS